MSIALESPLGLYAALNEAVSVAIVVAHPDDECLAAGGRLTEWKERVTIVQVTDGAPVRPEFRPPCGIEECRIRRRRESDEALQLAGVTPERMIALGIPDQETVTAMVPIAERLTALFERVRPEVVITHPYEGGHPDHDTSAFCVAAVCHLLEKRGRARPYLVEAPFYHADETGRVRRGRFLDNGNGDEVVFTLAGERLELKRKMMGCFASQREALAPFALNEERYRSAPRYRFSEPPHAGPLWYEQCGWPISGSAWRRYAKRAWRELCR